MKTVGIIGMVLLKNWWHLLNNEEQYVGVHYILLIWSTLKYQEYVLKDVKKKKKKKEEFNITYVTKRTGRLTKYFS